MTLASLHVAAARARWGSLYKQARRLADAAPPLIAKAAASLGDARPDFWWLELETGRTYTGANEPPCFGEAAWMPVKEAEGLQPLWQALHLAPSSFSEAYGGPTPLAAMLAGGLLTAGAGYGVGALGEKLLGPDVIEPGALKRRGALLGGLVGMAPGAYLGAVGHRLNGPGAWTQPNVLMGTPDLPAKAAAAREVSRFLSDADHSLADERPAADPAHIIKMADQAGADFVPSIPVDQFNRVVWQDPFTPLPLRAATSGLLEGASQEAGSPFISPWDVARIAVGMGTGLASGMLVGKTLGALAGLTPGAQKSVQRAGIWAGVLSGVVPRAFGF